MHLATFFCSFCVSRPCDHESIRLLGPSLECLAVCSSSGDRSPGLLEGSRLPEYKPHLIETVLRMLPEYKAHLMETILGRLPKY